MIKVCEISPSTRTPFHNILNKYDIQDMKENSIIDSFLSSIDIKEKAIKNSENRPIK